MARFKSWTREREQLNSERWNAIALGRNCWRLFQQLQVRDLGCVLDQQRMQQVCYCLDHSVVRFISPSDEIPWNVLLLFIRYSKICFPAANPDLTHIHRYVNSFVDKLKWRWIHTNNGQPMHPILAKLPRPTFGVPCSAT
jgi:hypothetical protein